MPLIFPSNTLSDAEYTVDNSCRFDGSSAYMTKTMGTPSDADKYTFSFWCKRSKLGVQQSIFRSTDAGTNDSHVTFQADDTLRFEEYGGGATIGKLQTTQVFRDVSAWYHVVLVWDSGNGVAGDRMKMYVNGSEVTAFGTDTNPSLDADSYFNKSGELLSFCRTPYSGGGSYFSGYVAEAVMCDGQAYAASDFGEFNGDSPTIWQPVNPSGLTFGTNGFYLDFEDSANLGNDASGGTDFTESGLDATDQATDTPTNNFCTMNPLENYYPASTFSNGNTTVLTINGSAAYNSSTIAVKNGKWYFEVELVADSVGNAQEDVLIGISTVFPTTAAINGGALVWGISPYGGLGLRGNGKMWAGTTETSGWANIDVGDVVIMAVDFDNGFLYAGIDGVWGNSGDPTSGATGTGGYSFTVGTDNWFIGVNRRTLTPTSTFGVNFGGSSGFTVSSGNADADGYGNFEYAVPSGYFALCTKNLGAYGG